jgi:hypothetical protein
MDLNPTRYLTSSRHVIDTIAYNVGITIVSDPISGYPYTIYRMPGCDVIVNFDYDGNLIDATLDNTNIGLDMTVLIGLFTGWTNISDILDDYDVPADLSPAGYLDI